MSGVHLAVARRAAKPRPAGEALLRDHCLPSLDFGGGARVLYAKEIAGWAAAGQTADYR